MAQSRAAEKQTRSHRTVILAPSSIVVPGRRKTFGEPGGLADHHVVAFFRWPALAVEQHRDVGRSSSAV
jgi:hypothetical protein